jgi:hypothetical protein
LIILDPILRKKIDQLGVHVIVPEQCLGEPVEGVGRLHVVLAVKEFDQMLRAGSGS